MRKNSKRASGSSSKAFNRLSLFGPPPLLEGEDETAYNELVARVSGAVGPTDFIEEIWVNDIVNVIWTLLIRLRRILAAYLANEITERINDKASDLAEANPELMEGTEEQKEAMKKLLDSDSELSWEARVAKYPYANEKFQKFWALAELTLDKDLIQARIIIDELDMIERIEHFITIAQRRFDSIIREIDRHRAMQKQDNGVQVVEGANLKTINPKMVVQKITNKKVA